jgi:serine phosphatase RsbU (regulator of sigma subunit)
MIQRDPDDERPWRMSANTLADVSCWNSPADNARAGGDWSTAFAISAHEVAVTIGDVAGHGEPVAASAASMRATIVEALIAHHDPARILAIANDLAFAHEGVIVTAVVGILDRRAGTFTFANAGHPPPVLVSDAGHAFLTSSPADLPLGIFPTHQAADYVIAVPPNALIVLCTDGITEHARDPIAGELEFARACDVAYADDGADTARQIAYSPARAATTTPR